MSSSGPEAVELARAAGLVLDPWQEHVLRVGLGERADGRWASSLVTLLVPRQNGKGAVLEALELANLVLFESRLVIHTAQTMRPVAMEHFRRMVDLLEASSETSRLIKRIGRANGDESIELTNGSRIKFVARSDTSARGMSGDLVVLDEAITVTPEQLAALMPTVSARPNPQVWVTSSAPLATSQVLHQLRQRALDGDTSVAFMEWGVDAAADVSDPRVWAEANPALGIRIPVEAVERELAAMPRPMFLRERLGVPDTPLVMQDDRPGVPVGEWRACTDEQSTVSPLVFAVEVSDDRSRVALCVAGQREDGRTHVEVVEWTPLLSGVVDRVVDLVGRWQVPVVVVDQSPAASLIPDLRRAGVEPRVLPRRELGLACAAFLDAVVQGRVVHINQTVLEVAVAEALRRDVGDVWVWDRRGRRDVSPLVGVTVAFWVAQQLLLQPAQQPFFVY